MQVEQRPDCHLGLGRGGSGAACPLPASWALTRGKLAVKEEQKQAKGRLRGAELAGRHLGTQTPPPRDWGHRADLSQGQLSWEGL